MPTWRLRADRRRIDYDRVADRLKSLADTVDGLDLDLVDPGQFNASDDAHNFRDFAPVGDLTHDELEVLEIVTEELLLDFGWLIDVSKSDID